MLALTVTRPWPMAFLRYGKRIENRSWPCPPKVIGSDIALHAGKKYDEHAAMQIASIVTCRDHPLPLDEQLPIYLRILAELHDEPYPPMSVFAIASVASDRKYSIYDDELRLDPFAFGPRCWGINDLGMVVPVECRGAQKLWKLPTEIENQLLPLVGDGSV